MLRIAGTMAIRDIGMELISRGLAVAEASDHLVAWTYAEPPQDQFHACRGGVEANGFAVAAVSVYFFFQQFGAGGGGNPTRTQRGGYRFHDQIVYAGGEKCYFFMLATVSAPKRPGAAQK